MVPVPRQPTPAEIEMVQSIQATELERLSVRREELKLEKQAISDNTKIAEASLKFQHDDRADERAFTERVVHKLLVLAGIIFIGVFILVGFMIFKDKDELLKKLAEYGVVFIGGAASGWSAKSSWGGKSGSEEPAAATPGSSS